MAEALRRRFRNQRVLIKGAGRGIGFRAGQDPHQRSLRGVVHATHSCPYPGFPQEVRRGEKEVLEEPEPMVVQSIHRVEGLRGR